MSFFEQNFKILNSKLIWQWSRGYRGTQRVQKEVQNAFLRHSKPPKIIKANKVCTLLCSTDWVLILYPSLVTTSKKNWALCKLENAWSTNLNTDNIAVSLSQDKITFYFLRYCCVFSKKKIDNLFLSSLFPACQITSVLKKFIVNAVVCCYSVYYEFLWDRRYVNKLIRFQANFWFVWEENTKLFYLVFYTYHMQAVLCLHGSLTTQFSK